MKSIIKIIFSLLIILILFFSFSNKSFSLPINSYIDNVNPPMNAVSVNRSSNITIVFTQPMNASTINNSNIKIFGYLRGLLSVNINYEQETKTLIINPNQDMKIGEEISVSLTDGIMTLGGQSISPFVYKFTIQTLGGNGIFIRTSGIPNVQSAYLKCGDIDGDGDIDLIVNSKVYKNDGNANFTFFTELNITGKPELADFDCDGDLDILIQLDSSVYFYRNDGGVFLQTYMFTGGVDNYGDLNGDGFLDITFFSPTSNLEIIKNINGVLQRDTMFNFSGNYKDKTMIADYNNDGALDVCTSHGIIMEFLGFFYLYRDFNLLKNNGTGKFIPSLILSDDPVGNVSVYDWYDSKSFDYDNDGYVDIMAPSAQIKNNANETFSRIANSGFAFSTSLASDFNGDGYIDLVTCLTYSPLFCNMNTNGIFTQFPANANNYVSLVGGDFDNDGDLDIAAFNANAQEVSILINSDIPSPVELSSFTSTVNSNTVTLNWTTAMEENNSGFDVERLDTRVETPASQQGGQDVWNKIGFVQGNGNSNSSHNYSYTDRNLQSGKYKYRLKQIDFNGNFKYYNLSGEVVIGIPSKMSLSQNYPNPFNPVTKLGFGISDVGFVLMRIYNAVGKEVVSLINEKRDAGYYEVSFDGSNLPSGMYFYRLSIDGNVVDTKRMALVK